MLRFGISRVHFDDAQLDLMLHGPNGPVGRYMKRKAREHVAASKLLVGKGSGQLARSIKWELTRGRTFQRITITADKHYAYYHHEGTNPHVIRAKRGGTLKFRSRGKVVQVQQVNHPGNRPNKFLTAPLRPIWGG